jgi:HAD superfamily hydrolase (TIGR01490 family)
VTRAAAFFDLDKTIIATSSALAFGRPFYQGGLITRRDVVAAAYARFVFRRGGADETQMDRTRDYLSALCRGWSVEHVQRIVADTLAEIVQPCVYDEAVALIAEHHAAGRDVIIVSTSGQDIVQAIGEMLGVDHVIATRMVIEDGRYTGEIEFYAAGPAKATAVVEMSTTEGYDLRQCYAYSDSVTDVPMLATVGHPYAVNPDKALRFVARERDWQVLEFKRPVALRQRRPHIERPGVPAMAAGAAVGVAAAVAGWYLLRRSRAASTA